MTQYLITAYDYTDAQALDRRLATRPAHLEGAKQLKANNHFILGGAMLDDAGKMIGSTMIVQFESEAQLKQWMDDEPYIKERVWEKVEVQVFRVANI